MVTAIVKFADIKTILDGINMHELERKKAPQLTLCFKNMG